MLRRTLCGLFLFGGCGLAAATSSAEAPARPEPVKGWGETPAVSHTGDLWFAGQPDQVGLVAARDAGVDVVVNLRHPSELDWDEEAVVESLGLRYVNVPIVGSEPLSQETFEQVDAVLAEHAGEQILVHCSSSNRVGAWYAAHLVTKQGATPEEALAAGAAAGLTNEAFVEKTRAHLATLVGEPAS